MSKKDKVLDKIRKLLRLAESSHSAAEVENALAQAEKLQKKYQINVDEIDISPSDIESEFLFMDTKTYEPRNWLTILSQVIAKGYNCELILVRGYKKDFIRIVGFKEDAELCENVIFSTKQTIRELANLQWKINGKTRTFRKDYISGFLVGLNKRLTEERKEKLFLTQAESDKYGLIVVRKTDLIHDFIDHNFNNLQSRRNRRTKINNPEAFKQGVQDGKQRNYNAKALC